MTTNRTIEFEIDVLALTETVDVNDDDVNDDDVINAYRALIANAEIDASNVAIEIPATPGTFAGLITTIALTAPIEIVAEIIDAFDIEPNDA